MAFSPEFSPEKAVARLTAARDTEFALDLGRNKISTMLPLTS